MNNDSSEAITFDQIIEVLEEYYPLELAQPWDKVGVITGARSLCVHRVLTCVDITQQVVDYARNNRYELILAHHPLALKPLHDCDPSNNRGAIITALNSVGIAVYTAHTNADAAVGGTSDIILDKLDVSERFPLEPNDIRIPYDQWHIYIPADHVSTVLDAIFTAGAGEIGHYSHCAWKVDGIGQYRASETAMPYRGEVDKIHYEPETKVEFIAPRKIREALYCTINATHPYQTPAYGVVELIDPAPIMTGIGRVGTLKQPRSVYDIASQLVEILPPACAGIRISGDKEAIVHTVGICTGAGDSLLSQVRKFNIDLYITADLRHHIVDEHHRAGGKAVIDAGHWATEYPWTEDTAQRLMHCFPVLTAHAYPFPTEPWTDIITHEAVSY